MMISCNFSCCREECNELISLCLSERGELREQERVKEWERGERERESRSKPAECEWRKREKEQAEEGGRNNPHCLLTAAPSLSHTKERNKLFFAPPFYSFHWRRTTWFNEEGGISEVCFFPNVVFLYLWECEGSLPQEGEAIWGTEQWAKSIACPKDGREFKILCWYHFYIKPQLTDCLPDCDYMGSRCIIELWEMFLTEEFLATLSR